MATMDLMGLVYADGQPFQPELPNGKPRCRGRAKQRGGAQCGTGAIPGATVCRVHGGAAPQVRDAAQIRLLELVNPAIATLARAMVKAPLYADQIRAAKEVLALAGVGSQSDMQLVEAARALMVQKAWEIVARREPVTIEQAELTQ